MLWNMPSSASHSTDTMTSYKFPNITSKSAHSSNSDADFHSVAFQLDLGLEIELLCDSNQASSARVFQLSWALVLACFLGKTDVAFAFVDLEHGQSTSYIHSKIGRDISATEAIQSTDEALESPRADVNTLLRISRDNGDAAVLQRSLTPRSEKDAEVSIFKLINFTSC